MECDLKAMEAISTLFGLTCGLERSMPAAFRTSCASGDKLGPSRGEIAYPFAKAADSNSHAD